MILQYYCTSYLIPSLLLRAFLGLFDSFLEFRDSFHELHEGIRMVFLTIAVVLLSNGYILAETILKGSIFLILPALTGIMGPVHTPIFLAQGAAFLNFCLFGNAKFVGICTLMLAFSGGFLSTFLHGLSLALELATTF